MRRIKRLKLSPYQDISVAHLLGLNFACLLDAPGVGKTPPALLAVWQKVQETGYPALVVAPAYLLSNWAREAHRWVPQARVSVVKGGTEDRRAALVADADIVVCSYHTLNNITKGGKPKFPEIDDRPWAVIVFDEAHRLRTRDSVWTTRVFKFRNATSRHKRTPVWLLTGTPFIRDGGNVWPFLYLYDRRRFKSYWKYVNEFCVTKVTPWATEVLGIRDDKLDAFHALMGEFSLRRTPQDVPELAHLEEVVYEHFLEMPKSVVASIKKMKKTYRLEHPELVTEFFKSSGSLWVRQRQLSVDPPTKEKPKLEWIQDFLEDHPGRVIVYCYYKRSAQAVYGAVSSRSRTAVLHTGDQSDRQREDALQTFRETEGTVVVATISSLKEGINLTESDTVVFLEHSTLPADNEQCIARLKRRGQNSLVQVHNVYCEETVDIAIQEVVSGRTTDINAAVRRWFDE